MKKNLWPYLLLALLLIFCAGCNTANTAEDYTYTSPDQDYSITLPGSWAVMLNTADGWETVSTRALTEKQQAGLQALANEQNTEMASLAALSFEGGETEPTAALVLLKRPQEDYSFEDLLTDHNDLVAYWQIDVQDMEIFELDGYPGFRSTGLTTGAMTIQQAILIDQIEYRFVLSSAPQNFEQQQDAYRAILDSFAYQP